MAKPQEKTAIRNLSSREALDVAADFGIYESEWYQGFVYRGSKGKGVLLYLPGRSEIMLRWIYVQRAYRRRGIGRILVERLMRKLRTGRRKRLVTFAEEKNLGSQLFLREVGFRTRPPIIILPNFFLDGGTAYRMERRRDE